MVAYNKKRLMQKLSMLLYDKQKVNKRLVSTKKSIDEVKKMISK